MQRYPGSIALCDHSAQMSQTDGLASWHKREMYILHLVLIRYLVWPIKWDKSLMSVKVTFAV